MADDDILKEAKEDDDILKEAKEAFQQAYDCEQENRAAALADLKFSRLEEQWPEEIRKKRELQSRPCLTISKMGAFIRQVVNDARQNKPSIKVHPVDSGADKETAEILNGLIRNIEYTSSADVAYDTATDYAVSMGFGYFRIGLDYAHEDTFDLDITIDRVSNPFSVYGDPMSTAADSSDWNSAFVVEIMSKEAFERDYRGAAKVDWLSEGYTALADPWYAEDTVMVAEWWRREEYYKTIYKLSDGTIQSEKQMAAQQDLLNAQGITVVGEREARCHRVKMCKLTGAEVIEEKYDWPGKYIPIVPVYGDEVNVEGKRYLRSLIRSAKGAQMMFNVWRSFTMESAALAPKTPFIGPKGAFTTDAAKWATANTEAHSYIEYDGQTPPARQGFVGVDAAAMQEALNASDDMKAIMGLYDASLGARSNETSGRAIMARQREGDVSTFHFQDNMTRAIRHAGRILVDLIPHVYDQARIIRVIGEDGSQDSAQINQPVEVTDENGQPQMQPDPRGQMVPGPAGPVPKMIPLTRIYDLTSGKYDVTVKAGPSFTTRREEAAFSMTETIRAFPQAAPVIAPHLAENLDWPDADKIAEELKKLSPTNQQGGIPPEVQKQIDDGMAKMQQLEQENAALKADQAGKQAELQVRTQEIQASGQAKAIEAQARAQESMSKAEESQAGMQIKLRELAIKEREAETSTQIKLRELEIKERELETSQFTAETDRMRLVHEMQQPPEVVQPPAVQ